LPGRRKIQRIVTAARARLGTVLIAFLPILFSCASLSSLTSDAYKESGIHVTTDPKAVAGLPIVNKWSTEFGPGPGAFDVGVWEANRLARDGRRNLLVLVELISSCVPPIHSPGLYQNMWRISVFSSPVADSAGGGVN
jgi:hypothetical protein